MSRVQEMSFDEQKIGEIVDFLIAHGAANNVHSGRSLLHHLLGTMNQLSIWEASETLCIAGLVHSVYGTECFQGSIIDRQMRDRVRQEVGSEAEQLAYLFGVMVNASFFAALEGVPPYELRNRLNGQPIAIDEEQLTDLCLLHLANWFEQRPRLPPEYRLILRHEYAKMISFLPATAARALCDAYGFE